MRDASRVALVLAESSGGIGAHVRELATALRAAGVEVTVVAPETTLARFDLGAVADLARAAPVGARGRGSLAAARELRRVARTSDVVHAHGTRAGATAVVARVHPLVVTWHNAPVGHRLRTAMHAGLERVVARGSDLTLGASEDLVRRACAAGARRARFVPVAAPPLPRSRRSRAEVLASCAVATDRPVVLAVSRLAPQKRLDVLLTSAREWQPSTGAVLLVAGDGPLQDSLRASARDSGVDVRWLGRRDDVGDLLSVADAAVLSSDWEARALVAQEALRQGTPLVATAVGGVPGLVGDAALLVPPGDAAALGRGVLRVLTDRGLATGLRRQGPERAASWPDSAEMLAGVLAAYDDVRRRGQE